HEHAADAEASAGARARRGLGDHAGAPGRSDRRTAAQRGSGEHGRRGQRRGRVAAAPFAEPPRRRARVLQQPTRSRRQPGRRYPTMSTTLLAPDRVARGRDLLLRLRGALNAVLLGQQAMLDLVLIALCARGHLLLEGLPGLGKTELVKALGRLLALRFRRVQFTPDILPADITGGLVLEEHGGQRTFTFKPGPIFANVVLADEINRASPKTQSAMLEAMQERRVTVFGETHPLPEPFFVLATQNPIELEGTYPLPEAQLDRFLFKVEVRNVPADVLATILRERRRGQPPELAPVID